ncbi:MAG TPA: FHA domain-containing protein [Aggregatilineales bacterium]|nr:FHA domain-containing protein [Aggregatilineales bacterium]
MGNIKIPLTDLLNQYAHFREAGATGPEAFAQLKAHTTELTPGELQQFGRLIQTWETRNTKKAIKPIQYAENPAVVKNATSTYDAEDVEICANCGRPNPKSDTYCYGCGHILISSVPPSTANLKDLDAETRYGTAQFGRFSVLILRVRGGASPIEVNPENEVVIGRTERNSPTIPDIDLAQYNAMELGVSRQHARLKRDDNTIALSDLSSTNGTFINGQQLHPHDVRVLHDGDEVRLGKMVINVQFKHQIRRI